MSAYLGQVEQLAADKLGAPVSIDALRIALLPSPRLNIEGLVIGKNKEISVERVAVVPAITSLFSDGKVLSSVQVSKPVIHKTALEILSALSKQPSTAPAAVNVNQIIVKEARLEWPGITLPEFNAEIALAANKPKSALINSLDGKLEMKLTPQNKLQKDKLQTITLSANKWTVPLGPPLLIDQLKVDMVLYDNRLEISRLNAALYKGKVSGNLILHWDNAWRMAGKIRVDDLAVREPVSLMSKSTNVSGRLFGNGSFHASAKEPAKLADHINADFRFKVTDGVLYGLDLARAATMLLHQGQKGGETRFDELSGLLNVAGKQYKFNGLKVTSGLMTASGNVKISPSKNLDGVVEVEVKRSVSMAAIPLQISGTLDNPTVFPTKAAMAGALAGTALLGPGVGTSMGVKAGSALSKLKGLFGGSGKQ
ncbi:MAG: AsmA family protein [Methylophilaceae bacterium]